MKFFCAAMIISTIPLFAKKIMINNQFKTVEQNIKNKVWFKILPIDQILDKNSNIVCQQCFGQVDFEFMPFPLSSLIPHAGHFKKCFILEIPQGRVQAQEGFVLIDDTLPKEMVWADRYNHLTKIVKIKDEDVQKISGRVAVISQEGYFNYCHFFNEILARLAMLEMHGIEYDWLYIACDNQFVKDGLKLWGVDESKIICPTDKNFCIQADILILPSLVLNTNNGFRHTGVNAHPYTLKYVREKLLSRIEGTVDASKFCKRIFISRRDAPSRHIVNEDEIFELFKAKGFERYDTGKMSVVEQIALFAQAEMVVGEHGAGLTSIMFCKQGTKVIELFQALIDTSFWFPAQIFHLDYIPVNTLQINPNYFANWAQINPNIYYRAMSSKVEIPLEKIRELATCL
jgi:hypothetical protein